MNSAPSDDPMNSPLWHPRISLSVSNCAGETDESDMQELSHRDHDNSVCASLFCSHRLKTEE